MSLYDARHTAGYKSSKLVQVCALIPEFHKEYPEAHITVKHVDFTGNRIRFVYKDEKCFTMLHDDIDMDIDAFIDLLDALVTKFRPGDFAPVEIARAFIEDIIISSADFMRVNTIGQKYFTQHDFYMYLHKLEALSFISKELVVNYLKKYKGRYPT